MKVRHSIYLVALVFCSWSQEIIAQEYPYLFRSAYFKGRGDTGIAIAEGEEAIFYNPAGLAISKSFINRIILLSPSIDISQDTRDVAREIALQESDPTETLRARLGKPQHLSVSQFTGVILKRAALGAFVNQSTSMMIYKSPQNRAIETVNAQAKLDAGITFSLAQWAIKDRLFFGATGKYIARSQGALSANAAETDQVTDINSDKLNMSGMGTGVDLGIMYRGKGKSPFSFGLTIQDVGNTIFIPTKDTTLSKDQRPIKDLTQTVNAGIAFESGTRFSKFRFLLDVRDLEEKVEKNIVKRLHVGSEFTARGFMGFTFGLNQGYPSVGLYLDLRLFRWDVGFYTEEVGAYAGSRPSNRYFIKLLAGL